MKAIDRVRDQLTPPPAPRAEAEAPALAVGVGARPDRQAATAAAPRPSGADAVVHLANLVLADGPSESGAPSQAFW